MRNKITLLATAALTLAACREDRERSSAAPESDRPIVLGCPVFRPTSLLGSPIACGQLILSPEDDVVTIEAAADGQFAMRIYAGTADGTFSFHRLIMLSGYGAWPFAVVADATGDGLGDVVVCDPGEVRVPLPGRATVFAQAPDGTFAASLTLSSIWPTDADSCDLDSDGARDVVILEGSMLHRIENGVATTITLPGSYDILCAGSFGAGTRKLAAADLGSDTVRLLDVGSTDATVWASVTISGAWVAGLQSADIDADGASDLLVRAAFPALDWSERVKVLRNASGAFTEFAQAGMGGSISEFEAADTSGDGKPDVFVCEWKDGWNFVSVSYSNASGGLNAPIRLIEGVWSEIVAGAFNSAAPNDLLFGPYLFRGGENPDAVRNFNLGGGPRAVAIGNFNGDAYPDLAAFLAADGELAVALGTGPWSFGTPSRTPTGLWWADEAATGDLNGDGKLDIVVRDGGQAYWLAGNGTGAFGAPSLIGTAFGIALLDTNADGALEVAHSNLNADAVRVFRASDGTAVTYAVAGGPRALAAGDFNSDGQPDLAVCCLLSREVRIIAGGAVGPAVPLPGRPWHAAAGDVNADTKIDLIVGSDSSGFWLLRGNGAGGLAAAESFISPHFETLVLHDFNADGAADLVGLDVSEFMLWVGAGGTTPFASVNRYPGAWTSWSLTIADANGDGAKDVAVGNEGLTSQGDPILIWKNASLP